MNDSCGAAQEIITWLKGDTELLLDVQDFLPGNDYEYGITELKDWLEDLLYAPGIYAYRPEGLARMAALADVRKAVTRSDFLLVDWELVSKSLGLDSPK